MQLILTAWLKFIQSYEESTGEHMEQNYKQLTNWKNTSNISLLIGQYNN